MNVKRLLFVIAVTLFIGGCAKDSSESAETPAMNEEAQEEKVEEESEKEVKEEREEEDEALTEEVDEEEAEPREEREVIDYETPDSLTVLVNKEHALPDGYEPADLTVPDVRFPFEEDDPKKQLRQEAADALEKLFHDAEAAGHFLFAQSGYRSYERQEVIFASNVNKDGEEAANKYSARPGESEHQTGLVMDITSEAVGFGLIEAFGETPEGKWVAENAHEYGFIIRYEQGKEDITQYQYEPWHLRYVGTEAAKAIYENDWTLEQYVGVIER